MPRRALRKIAVDADLSAWLKSLESLQPPLDRQGLFGREARFEVELGSGKGLFLSAAAAATPQTDFLGLEVAGKYARHIAAKLAQRGLDNARVIHGDGLRVFREFLGDASVAAIHVYFPDPWWKARHKKRRVINESFLRDVVRTLEPGGSLHFWTDVEEYFQTALALIAETTPLVGPLDVVEQPAAHDLDFRTHFERRTRLHALPVYRSEFRKSASPATTSG